ncbi:hypothetical protein IGS67_12135 [Flavimobilis sp. GY10621]|uniref:Uncharacterized protein n=1 Tax=Flavimobilis rhizosphaerae TaxID=2775421 RepID=A0ABR9DV86_9MICO|nr:hypothetical protein [Flavimobilis rhizosphaerae]MBD9700227.1 hypothetical protein [Flavimobilis rhizosphaerae]
MTSSDADPTQAPAAGGAPVADRASAWSWRLGGREGVDAVAAGMVQEPPAFARRFDAEVWLGARWRSLATSGVERCVLQRGGTDVGAPLPLPVERA